MHRLSYVHVQVYIKTITTLQSLSWELLTRKQEKKNANWGTFGTLWLNCLNKKNTMIDMSRYIDVVHQIKGGICHMFSHAHAVSPTPLTCSLTCLSSLPPIQSRSLHLVLMSVSPAAHSLINPSLLRSPHLPSARLSSVFRPSPPVFHIPYFCLFCSCRCSE